MSGAQNTTLAWRGIKKSNVGHAPWAQRSDNLVGEAIYKNMKWLGDRARHIKMMEWPFEYNEGCCSSCPAVVAMAVDLEPDRFPWALPTQTGLEPIHCPFENVPQAAM